MWRVVFFLRVFACPCCSRFSPFVSFVLPRVALVFRVAWVSLVVRVSRVLPALAFRWCPVSPVGSCVALGVVALVGFLRVGYCAVLGVVGLFRVPAFPPLCVCVGVGVSPFVWGRSAPPWVRL